MIFGAAALGDVSKADADRALELLLEHGINHIDVAASYGDAELRIANWLGAATSFFVATKTGERTYAAAREQIRRSLDRLGVDHVDSIQLHNLCRRDRVGHRAQPRRRAGGLRSRRATRAWCASSASPATASRCPEMHLRSLERFAFDSVLCPYNYVQMQDPRYAETFDELAAVCTRARRRAADDQEPRPPPRGRAASTPPRPGTSR